MDTVTKYLEKAQTIAVDWITSPAAWVQFALLAAAFVLAFLVRAWLSPRLKTLLEPPEDNVTPFAAARRFSQKFLPLLLPLLAYAFTAAGEAVARSLFDSGTLIAFGKRLLVLLAAWIFYRKVVYSPFLRVLTKFVLLPVAVLYAVGLLPAVTETLDAQKVLLGDIEFSYGQLVTAFIAGALLFWVGRWSNEQGTDYIRKREDMRPSMRELSAKSFEMAVYVAAFLLFANIAGLPMGSFAVLGGAVGVGIGFGLQKIASNFISGIILLVEGQATVGDYVALDGGEEGRIVRMMARATILQTFDGRWIVVPNEDFITTRVVNYSDAGSAKRYEVEFSVSYDSDLDQVIEICRSAIQNHPDILSAPELADVEVDSFGDSGINMLAEFWAEGLDDGPNKYTSDIRLLIWRTLKENNISIPFPQREIRILGDGLPAGMRLAVDRGAKNDVTSV